MSFLENMGDAMRGANEANDRFTSEQDRKRRNRRQDEGDAIAREELSYSRGRRVKDDAYTDESRERETANNKLDDAAKDLQRRAFEAARSASAGDFTLADALASDHLKQPVRTTQTPDGKISLDVNGKIVVADSLEHYLMGNPRKGKRAGFLTMFSDSALANWMSQRQQAEGEEERYAREDSRDSRQYGRQVALQDRAQAINERNRVPQMLTQADGTVLERFGNSGSFRPATVDDGRRPPPPGLAPQGEAWQPGSEPKFGGQPPGGPRPLQLAPGMSINGRGAQSGSGMGAGGNPFGTRAKAEESWMAVRAMAAADESGALAQVLQEDPFKALALLQQMEMARGDQATRAKIAAQFVREAQSKVFAMDQIDPGAMQATVQNLLDVVDNLSGGAPESYMGGGQRFSTPGMGGTPGAALMPQSGGPAGGRAAPPSWAQEGVQVRGPDGKPWVIRNGVPVPVGG